MRTKLNNLLTPLLVAVLAMISVASAQAETDEWEYLVVSYGTTYFSNPLLDAGAADATFSKIQLFSEIGVTLPQEAITLQRNIDILGIFGWEMVTVVGSIGGDQQIVFKRPYDAERSATEAESIKAERDKLIALYNDSDGASHNAQLVDVDAVERAQAINSRNERDAAAARKLIEAAAASGYKLPALELTGNAPSPDSDARVQATITQDVTAASLIAPGQYRKSLVTTSVEQLQAALEDAGMVKKDIACGFRGAPRGEITVRITAVINHDGTTTEVGTYRASYCFDH